jgi:serpin B
MIRLRVIAVSLGTLLACTKHRVLTAEPVPFDAMHTVRADRDFAARLYGTQRANADNLFLSPASVRIAMAMVYSGARGETAAEMAKAVGLSRNPEQMNAHFGPLLQGWNHGTDSRVQLKVVDRLWGQTGLKFLPPFLDGLRDAFAAPLEKVDFYEAPEPSRVRINAWVEESTERLIRDLLVPGDIKGKNDEGCCTRLVVTNAIYFKGDWQKPFSKASTTDAAFHVKPGVDVQARFMSAQDSFLYGQYDGTKLVSLPYGEGSLTMTILLPDDATGLEHLETALDGGWIEAATGRLERRLVNLTIPKFSTTVRMSLKSALSKMGMPLAFMPRKADLSGIDGELSPQRRLFVDDVIHKAHLTVDEQGTTAAAATAVLMATPVSGSSKKPPEPVPFRAERPFVYLICDKPGNVLFMGRLMDPTQKGSD